jgi:homogentisate 1,2-dioxygenase
MVAFKQSRGVVSPQGQARIPAGTHEDQYSRSGFEGDQTMLYRLHPPTAFTRVEGDFRMRAADTNGMRVDDAFDARALPTKLMFNDDAAIFLSKRATPMPFIYRNVDGDEVIHVHQGEGVLHTEFGPLEYRKGDYLVVPKGVAYRLRPTTTDNMFYVVQTSGQVGFPDRGLLGSFVPFDLGVLEIPEPEPPANGADGEWEVVVKRNDRLTSYFYPFDPMDVVGWQGTVAPFRLSMYDIRSISSQRLDIPPSGYATFRAPGVIIATFTPHPMQSDPDSTFVPPFHRNMDYDEVAFVLGTEQQTDVGASNGHGLQAGMLFAIPQGVPHGPEQDQILNSGRPERFELYLLTIDVERPLTFTPAFEAHVPSGNASSLDFIWPDERRPGDAVTRQPLTR